MIENSLEHFGNQIVSCLTGEQKDIKGLLVKKHNDNLQTHGDFSFPISVKSWQEYLECDHISDKVNTTIFQALASDPEYLIEVSKDWNLHIHKVELNKDRLFIFMDRPRAIYVGLAEALTNSILLSQYMAAKCSRSVLDPLCQDKYDITSMRTEFVCKVTTK